MKSALLALCLIASPLASADPVFEETGGLVTVEAEHFCRQEFTARRAWHVVPSAEPGVIRPDPDGPHLAGASGGAYLEVLPDTRATHDDPLVAGENYVEEPGRVAVLSYRVHFATPGRYYFWARAFSTGTEDNGLHVGLDGTWPASGRRWQTVKKNAWAWDSRQRTGKVPAGVPGQLFLDVADAGEHTVQLSMREDGFELDKWLMTTDRNYVPEGAGPASRVRADRLPPATPGPVDRRPDGDGTVTVAGELKQWHKVTLNLAGPFAAETDLSPNPFTDCRLAVIFTHESGAPRYVVPGYFAADGDAANTSAAAGTVWRAHLSPDRPGRWTYQIAFVRGPKAAIDGGGDALAPYDGKTGEFIIAPTDKTGRDSRARGRLTYVGGHHLRHAGTGEYFLKLGADSPETLLASADFDATIALKENIPLKTWSAHVRDWRPGDPVWGQGRGRGLIGALNYLAAQGVNSISFLTYNAAGDGDNVWPFIARDEKFRYDCSKLDQWQIVFDHAQSLGLHLHFKLQENENDDHRLGRERAAGRVPEALDGGATGPERKLYLRELIARFGHALALNWNLGEENTQSADEQRAMARFIRATDPYGHPLVIHTFPEPEEQDLVYTGLLGDRSVLTGASLQTSWNSVHRRTLNWRRASAAAGRPWVVANDEQGPASGGVPPDPGYQRFAGRRRDGRDLGYTIDDIRQSVLWGNLLAGGGGCEYYFGYELPGNDLLGEDFRSRERSWTYGRLALEFFRNEKIPFERMINADELAGNAQHDNSVYVLALPGRLYLVYLPKGGTASLDLTAVAGEFTHAWFNPRTGGAPTPAGGKLQGGTRVTLTAPEHNDWLAVVRSTGSLQSIP